MPGSGPRPYNGGKLEGQRTQINRDMEDVDQPIGRKETGTRPGNRNRHTRISPDMLQLRPYQERAVAGVRSAFLRGLRAPLLVLPTGGGKTVCFCDIAMKTAARNKNVWILVHRVELLRQTSRALTKSGVFHGLINPNFTPNYTAKVQVASVQTLANRLGKLPPPDLIIIDEAHHATAGTWRKICAQYPQAYILGVTATPVRGDGKGLGKDCGGTFDTIVMGPQIQELIDMGFLVPPIVYAPRDQIDLSDVSIKMGDYDRGELELKVDKPGITGDAVDHYTRLCPGEPAVAFCISIKHAEHVAAKFTEAGYRAFAVDGTMEDDKRQRLLAGLGNGTVDVICSCDLISEGTDIPAIACAIMLRPTQSLGLYLQQGGRALRPCAGKARAIILDHVCNALTHGLLQEEREWSLDGVAKKKKKKKQSGPIIKVIQCEECYCCYEPVLLKCPQCGFAPERKFREPNVREGELSELSAEAAAMFRKKQRGEIAAARTEAELRKIAELRGYKEGWVNHVLRSRQTSK